MTFRLVQVQELGPPAKIRPAKERDGFTSGAESCWYDVTLLLQYQTVETVFEALFLREDAPHIAEARSRALEQLWTLANRDGRPKGGWPWYNANLEPWEGPSSFYMGSAIAALAIGSTPPDDRSKPEIRQHIQELKDYLLNGLAERPLQNRLELL